jgi:hypothetical protein
MSDENRYSLDNPWNPYAMRLPDVKKYLMEAVEHFSPRSDGYSHMVGVHVPVLLDMVERLGAGQSDYDTSARIVQLEGVLRSFVGSAGPVLDGLVDYGHYTPQYYESLYRHAEELLDWSAGRGLPR